MYHSTSKKWLTVTNNDFKKDVFNKIQDACKQLEGNDEQIFTLENQQLMGKCLFIAALA